MIKNKSVWLGSVVFGGIMIAYSAFLDYVTRTQGNVDQNFQSLVATLGLFFAFFEYKKNAEGILTFKEGLKLGYIVTLFGGFVYSIYTSYYLNFIRPEEKKRMLDFQAKILSENGFSQDEINTALEVGNALYEPLPLVIVSTIALLISTSFSIFLLSFIMRTNTKTTES